MKTPQTILLIGLRGSGKSTLGGMIAENLGCAFTDLDALTLRRMGFSTVIEAWEAKGEPAFRVAEIDALKVAIDQGGVIALGGGTPIAPGGEDLIRSSDAISIYLRGEPTLLRDRLTGSLGADRPSLTGSDPLDEIERIFKERDPKYSAIADHVVALRAHEHPDETLVRLVGMIG